MKFNSAPTGQRIAHQVLFPVMKGSIIMNRVNTITAPIPNHKYCTSHVQHTMHMTGITSPIARSISPIATPYFMSLTSSLNPSPAVLIFPGS